MVKASSSSDASRFQKLARGAKELHDLDEESQQALENTAHRTKRGLSPIHVACVLDFYVEESFQRQGAGRALFDAMLAAERTTPEQLAYDRPSPKLLRFMGKHFRLTKYAPQQNNFVLYDAFWASEPHPQPGKSASQYDTISMRPLTARGAHPRARLNL